MAVGKFVFEIILESVEEKGKKNNGGKQSALAERVLSSHIKFWKKKKNQKPPAMSTPFYLDSHLLNYPIPGGNEQRV